MTDTRKRLTELDKDIRISVAGIGSVGKGIVLQSHITPGIKCVAIADIIIERAISIAELLEMDYRIVESTDEMEDTISQEILAICADGDLIASCETTDIFIEATSSIPKGGKHAISAINHDNHVVMMNYESDLMFGPYLMKLAKEKNCIYTVCDGDQPTVLKHLIDEMEFMGFELVMAGNIKGYLDRSSNPTSIIPEADKRDLDYHMCTAYTDGSKLSIEMAVLANGLGLRTDAVGMHGPKVDNIENVFNHFNLDVIWRNKQPIVDYVLGCKPRGGVFTIGYTDNKYQQDTLAWLPPNMGSAPFYLFYRPYHLCHFESMASIASIALDKKPILQPNHGFQTNVYSHAKSDLKKGQTLDGLGGYTCYGMIENCIDNKNNPGIPICLTDKLILKKDIAKNEKLNLQHVDYDTSDYAYQLYQKALDCDLQ